MSVDQSFLFAETFVDSQGDLILCVEHSDVERSNILVDRAKLTDFTVE